MYVAAMDRTLHLLFRSYHEKLMKLEMPIASKQDLVAVEDAALRSVFTQKVCYTCNILCFCWSNSALPHP